MGERQDFIPLSTAAAVAHERLFPGEAKKDPKMLEVITLALSGLLPIHRLTTPTGAQQIVCRRDLMAALPRLQIASIEAGRASLTLRQSPR